MRSSRGSVRELSWLLLAAVLAAMAPAIARAQSTGEVTVLGAGSVGQPAAAPATILSADELESLVAPVALYPDDLLAVVLPASTFPLQVVQAARFLEAARQDSSLKPDEDWDDSVVALLNYPEVLEKLSEDLDWTWELGQAVLAQQEDVVAAVASFRDRAHTAGNLKSDDRQIVEVADNTIHIKPANPEVIYVPYYEPSRVVVYQRAPVYYYYPRAYPVYYYPYPAGYHFYSGFFWGVTTYYSLGWHTRHVHIHHHNHHWHPYYDRWSHYDFGHYYYRRPRTVVHNHYYFPPDAGPYHDGNAWKPYDRRASSRPGRPHYWADRYRHRDGDGHRYDGHDRDSSQYRDSDADRYRDAERDRDRYRDGERNRYRDDGANRAGDRRWAGADLDGDHRRDRARHADRRDHASLSGPIEGRARIRQPDQARPDARPQKAPPTYRMPEQRNNESRMAWAEREQRAEPSRRGHIIRQEPENRGPTIRPQPENRGHAIRQERESRGRWAAAASSQPRVAEAPRPQVRSFSAERAPHAVPEPRRAERSEHREPREPRGHSMREQDGPRGDPSPPRHGHDGDRARFTPR